MIKEVNNKFKILLLFSINLYLIKYSYNKISDANMNILIKKRLIIRILLISKLPNISNI